MKMNLLKQILVVFLSCLLVQFTARADSYGPIGQSGETSPVSSTKQSAKELQQLVAPIALYPDALVAQILAASTYPTQIVEAERWMQSHSDVKGEELAKEVDKQDWDPSVKALAQFPSVLENMNKNLSWTSSLGEAYVNQPQDVSDAVQTLREDARKAGHLNSNEQEKVTTQGNTIIIEPANPQVVYVPAYDPWLVYGAPIIAYPGWYPVPGIFWGGVGLSFGIGFGLGFFGGYGWGWHHWGYDWHGRRAFFDHHAWESHSRDFGHEGFHHGDFGHGHGDFGHGGFDHGNVGHGGSTTVTSATAVSITVTPVMAVSITAADSTDLPAFTPNPERTPHLAALITAEMPEAFLPAGNRALEVASTAVAPMVGADVIK